MVNTLEAQKKLAYYNFRRKGKELPRRQDLRMSLAPDDTSSLLVLLGGEASPRLAIATTRSPRIPPPAGFRVFWGSAARRGLVDAAGLAGALAWLSG